MYVFDTSPLSTLFKNYYPSRFPTLWAHFDALITSGSIVSTREVCREIMDGPVESARLWADQQKAVFHTPVAAEATFIAQIYSVAHFQQNIEQQKLLKGGRNADPFVVAKAATEISDKPAHRSGTLARAASARNGGRDQIGIGGRHRRNPQER